MAEFITPCWPAPAHVAALTTVRNLPGHSKPPFDAFNLGAHCGDDTGAVTTNRQRLIALASLPNPPHWLQQVHGVAVHRVTSRKPDATPPQADAAVTAIPGAVLAILTADCLPVLFVAKDGSEVAAAHAGWRGLAAGVLEATVAAMYGTPESIVAWLGPAAGPAHYEIGEEVRTAFIDHDPGAATCFTATRPGHHLIDLYGLARRRLAAAGITTVSGGDLCTISDATRFYSYRRDGRTGRMATLVWMRERPASG